MNLLLNFEKPDWNLKSHKSCLLDKFYSYPASIPFALIVLEPSP